MLIFEKGILGGITQAVKRYAKANNKYMNELYNPDEVSIFLQYLDINNEYGCAMTKDLPTHGFLCKKAGFTPEKMDELIKKDELLKKNKRGYISEVDVEYPRELHESHNELSFLTEGMKIGRVENLVPNLNHKKGYVIQIKTLNQVLKHGLKPKKVHRVSEFQKSKWMKAYIMLNTRLRMAAKMSNAKFQLIICTNVKDYLVVIIF